MTSSVIYEQDGWTALILASSEGRTKVVRYLLEETETNVNVKDKKGGTALLYAVTNGHLDVVKLLVEGRANPNSQDRYGDTALHYASISDNMAIIQYLVERAGSDPSVKNSDGKTALDIARAESKIDVVHYLETGQIRDTQGAVKAEPDQLLLSNTSTSVIVAAAQAPSSSSLPPLYTCHACMAKFLNVTQVFCGECGTKRRDS
jgi:ankyrin repeat protein